MNKIVRICSLYILFFNTSMQLCAQGTWFNAGLSYPGMVMAMTAYNGNIEAGGVYSAPEQVRAMAVYNGSLYSGGDNIGGVTHVFSNGNSVGYINGGGPITSMAVYNNELYVGGYFDSINGIAASNIAKYNGFTWSAVAGGVFGGGSGMVYSLGVYNNELYAGTNFGSCYKWNGTTWTSVGTFASSAGVGLIRGFAVYNGDLYAGGFFEAVNGIGAVNIARYDGFFWYSVGDVGIAGDPGNGLSVMTEFNGELYCGGNFGVAGGTTASCIARYNGGNWQACGSGTSGVVNAMAVLNQNLYVAGNFNTAGGITVGNVARWFICTSPTATISYSGAPYLCNPGGSFLLSANTGTGLNYQWRKGNSNISGATSSTYLVPSSGADVYRVVVTNTSGCSTTSSGVPVSSNTTFANNSATGPTTFCTGGSVVLNALVSAGYTYQWKNNGVVIPGATLSSYTATTSGNYVVDETNGPCTKTSQVVVVTVNPLPSATITPNGNLNFCTGPGVTLQANTGAGLTYQWRKNSVNIAGATNSGYLANSTGTFNVVVTNNSGCSKGATPVNVTSPPSITITPSGATHFCTGGSVTLNAASGQTVTYKWKKNGAYITGATNSSFVATSTGSYNCVVTNSFGCSKGGTPVAVTGPPSAVITANGPTTFCTGGSVQLAAQSGYTYQWIKNSGNITGATQQNYIATTAGNYKVKVTDPFGCSKTTPNSNQITINVPCREGHFANEINQSLTIYPNPSRGLFELTAHSSQSKNAEIEVYSTDGRLINKQTVETNNPFNIDLSQQASGIYFIHAMVDGRLISKKMAKQ